MMYVKREERFSPKTMDISEIGDVYELKREQWKGHTLECVVAMTRTDK